MALTYSLTYETLFEDVLQDRLDHPQTWKEMCDVMMTDARAVSTSYLATDVAVTTVSRGTGLVMVGLTETADTLTISTGRDVGIFVDWADLAQSPWTKPAEIFDRIGAVLNEFIESNVLGQHSGWTDVGTSAGVITSGVATQITVSASNIDDIIRGVKRIIRVANGNFLMNQNGVGFVWRPADFEFLEAFVQANGFVTADQALKEGTVEGIKYLGADHYFSNDHTANHLFAGVKKVQRLGILRGTYGRAHTIDFPAADSNTFFSGQAFYSRVDIGHLTPFAHSSLVYDINVV